MASWEEMEKLELKDDEGLRLKAYKDSLGKGTIGYGHLLRPGDPEVITEAQAEDIFESDFEKAVTEAQEAVAFFAALDGPRKGAMVNMAFQMGGAGLAAFHATLDAMDREAWDEAAQDIMNSKYARQTRARAQRIAYRVRTGQYAVR